MMNRTEELKKYMTPGKKIHLVGIGGVSMRPLGLVLKGMGMIVTGSDMNASVSTNELIEKGIPVFIGHNASNIEGVDCIIRTAAAHNDNPEIAAARVSGIPTFERAEAWGVIMQAYQNSICVAGTHGKTTATSMVTHILMEAKKDPTVMIGGYLPLLHAGHRVGSGDSIVLESCEYCDSFLNFFPTLAVILNIEADHLDYFKDLADVEKSFRKFAMLARDKVLANGDDPHVKETLDGMPYVTFGFGPENQVTAENISADWRHLDVVCGGNFYCHLDLAVVGRHNALNALAAAGVAWLLGIDGASVTNGLATFTGADRRLQYKGKLNGADIYDDYAHHPDEIRATIDAVRTMNYKRIVIAFQPHTYTRTKALFDDFVQELKKADLLILAEIYAARERNTVGISSMDLVSHIPGAVYCQTLQDVTEKIRAVAQPGDVILTVGAGDIFRAGEALFNE